MAERIASREQRQRVEVFAQGFAPAGSVTVEPDVPDSVLLDSTVTITVEIYLKQEGVWRFSARSRFDGGPRWQSGERPCLENINRAGADECKAVVMLNRRDLLGVRVSTGNDANVRATSNGLR